MLYIIRIFALENKIICNFATSYMENGLRYSEMVAYDAPKYAEIAYVFHVKIC